MATTSKAFRARALDSNRSMTVYWGHELPDLSECSVGNRAVTQMPSGMEKEEEQVGFWWIMDYCSILKFFEF